MLYLSLDEEQKRTSDEMKSIKTKLYKTCPKIVSMISDFHLSQTENFESSEASTEIVLNNTSQSNQIGLIRIGHIVYIVLSLSFW